MANKKQMRSARNNSRGKNAHRKANMPAKAGRRKIYVTGKRKVKSFADAGNGFVMKERQDNDPAFTMVCKEQWTKGQPVMVRRVS